VREGVGWASLTPCAPGTGILLLCVSCCQIPRPPRRFLPGLQRAGSDQRNLDVVHASPPPARPHAGAAGHRGAGRRGQGRGEAAPSLHATPVHAELWGEPPAPPLAQQCSGVGWLGVPTSELKVIGAQSAGLRSPPASLGWRGTRGCLCRETPRTTRGSSCWPCCSPAP